jgi:hypothetical protein
LLPYIEKLKLKKKRKRKQLGSVGSRVLQWMSESALTTMRVGPEINHAVDDQPAVTDIVDEVKVRDNSKRKGWGVKRSSDIRD